MTRILCALTVLALAGTASAQTWNAVSPGSLPATAEIPVGVGPLTNITGTVSTANPANRAHYFMIRIADPANFSARTDINPGTGVDTALYLMNLNGTGIAANDDISGTNFLSLMPVGDPAYATLPAGDYLLLVTSYGVLPAWSSTPSIASLIFNPSPFTGVRTPQNNNVHSTYLFFQDADPGGSYNVTLTGVEFIPTPGAVPLLGLGGLAALRRRR
jgi:uncharacterized protein (TIGR03382 family)